MRYTIIQQVNLFLTFLIFLLIGIESELQSQNSSFCGSDQVYEKLISENDKLDERSKAINKSWVKWQTKLTATYINTDRSLIEDFEEVRLPIVFHDLTFDNDLVGRPILETVVIALNEEYATEAKIRFCLAEVDFFDNGFLNSIGEFPIGDIPTGILDNDSNGQIQAVSNVIQESGRFPTDRYINVYVVDDIANPVAGFAYGPEAHGESFDGIYIEREYIEDIGDVDINNIAVLVHEMGHYLGLLHTFGRSQDPTVEISCTNDNCLFDGDMVCDTPPDMINDNMCVVNNSCSTDGISLLDIQGNELNPLVGQDVPDYISNFMDYSSFGCQSEFTSGQASRMRCMIDEEIGPRNSLLNSNVCSTECILAEGCDVVINELPIIQLVGVDYEHTLPINGMAITNPFTATINICDDVLTEYEWTLTNLDSDLPISTGTSESFTGIFEESGNFRVDLKVSILNSNPECFKLASYDLKVVTEPSGPGDCIDINWDDFQRIQYTNGWVWVEDDPDYLRDQDLEPEGAIMEEVQGNFNDPSNSSRFAILENQIPIADPNFSGMSLPNGIEKVFRVGQVIDGEPDNFFERGIANYVTYSFVPTEENRKIRVWYLGIRADPSNSDFMNTSWGASFAFPNNTNSANGFGMAFGYTDTNGTFQNLAHNMKGISRDNYNNFFFDHSNIGLGNVDGNETGFIINGEDEYTGTEEWLYHDLDLSYFICNNEEVTLTFYARTNSAESAFFHAYAYFGLQCLPAVEETPIEFNLPNLNASCRSAENNMCFQFSIPIVGSHLMQYNFARLLPSRLSEIEVFISEDGVNFDTPYGNAGGSVYAVQPDRFSPTVEFELCIEPDESPVTYFKVFYNTPCKVYEDTFAIHQSFEHQLDPCPFDEEPYGGRYEGDVGTITYCGFGASIELTKPCWVNDDTDDVRYQWQVDRGGWTNIIANGSNEILEIDESNMNEEVISQAGCHRIRRLAYYTDPYCGYDAPFSSEILKIVNLELAYPQVALMGISNICFGEELNITLDVRPTYFLGCLSITDLHDMTCSIFYTNGTPVDGVFMNSTFDEEISDLNVNEFIQEVEGLNYEDFHYQFENINRENFGLYYELSGSFQGCPYFVSGNIFIGVYESAVGGEIALEPCSSPVHFLNIGDDNNGNGYTWEYSYDNIFFDEFFETNTIDFTLPNNFECTSLPVYIRRKAWGIPMTCPMDAYSNVIVIDDCNSSAIIPEFNLPTLVCSGEMVNLLPQSDNGYAGQWMPETFDPYMTMTYVFTPDDIGSCTENFEITIVIDDNCCNINIGLQSSTICEGNSMQLCAINSEEYSFIWSTGETSNCIVVSPQETTTYSVTVTDIEGCASTDEAIITIDNNCGGCDNTLVQYGYGAKCEDSADDFDPDNISSCIGDATNLSPYNGPKNASCQSGVICVASVYNGWSFTLTANGNIHVDYLLANFFYPLGGDTPGGTTNDPDNCPDEFEYLVTFSKNMEEIESVSGSISNNAFYPVQINLSSPIILEPNETITVQIDGVTLDEDCDLFELGGLSVHGCCRPCLANFIDLGPDQVVCAGDEITLTAEEVTSGSLEVKVESKQDDAEESPSGEINITSSDLELVDESGEINQTVGIRFQNLTIPYGATITSAYIQFKAQEDSEGPADLTIKGQLSIDPLEFNDEDDDDENLFDISMRSTTGSSINWLPNPWEDNDKGLDQQTPDLSPILQEIIELSGWDYGNSMVFVITGIGEREADSYDGSSTHAPQLFVEYDYEGTGPYLYEWSTGATTPSITVSPEESGSYTVTVTNSNGCSQVESVGLKIDDSCCRGVNIVVDCNFPETTLTAVLKDQIIDASQHEIRWQVLDVLYPKSVNPLIVKNEIGSYYRANITLKTDDRNECQSRIEGIITCPESKGFISVFPNPRRSSDDLYLIIEDERFLKEKVEFSINSNMGKFVTKGEFVGEKKKLLNVEKLQEGIYLLTLVNHEKGITETIKFQVYK